MEESDKRSACEGRSFLKGVSTSAAGKHKCPTRPTSTGSLASAQLALIVHNCRKRRAARIKFQGVDCRTFAGAYAGIVAERRGMWVIGEAVVSGRDMRDNLNAVEHLSYSRIVRRRQVRMIDRCARTYIHRYRKTQLRVVYQRYTRNTDYRRRIIAFSSHRKCKKKFAIQDKTYHKGTS